MTAGRATIMDYIDVKVPALRAGLDLCSTRAERLEIRREILQRYEQAETWTRRRFQSGRTSEIELGRKQVDRLEAEIALLTEELAD